MPLSLFKLLTALADAGATEVAVGEDFDGQIVLYTNLQQDPEDETGDTLIEFED